MGRSTLAPYYTEFDWLVATIGSYLGVLWFESWLKTGYSERSLGNLT